MIKTSILVCAMLCCVCTSNVYADDIASVESVDVITKQAHTLELQELSKKLNDPLAKLMYIPISGRMLEYTQGPFSGSQVYEVSVRPTFPIMLNDKFMLINHVVVPYFNSPYSIAAASGGNFNINPVRQNAINPIQVMSMLAANKPKGINAGIGPYINVPVDKIDGSYPSFGAGGSIIVRYANGPWITGGLVQNAWNMDGSQFFMLSPGVSYNFTNGWSIISGPYITANFANRNGSDLTLPVGGGASKVFKLGSVSMRLGSSVYYNIVRPDTANTMEVRVGLSIVSPQAM